MTLICSSRFFFFFFFLNGETKEDSGPNQQGLVDDAQQLILIMSQS